MRLLLIMMSYMCALSSALTFQKFLSRSQPRSERSREVALPLSMTHSTVFDMDLAVVLGAHAFDAYIDPSVGEGKNCAGLDQTTITISDSEFIQRSFTGLLIGTLKKGQFRNEKEEDFTERLISGGQPDLYVNMHIEENDSSRVLESYRSNVKPNNIMPEWRESFSFYIRGDPSKATLKINAFDEDMFSEDDFIGSGELKLEQLLANVRENEKALVEVPVPIYEEKQAGWFGLGGGKRRKGTVMVELQFVPFASDSASASADKSGDASVKMRAPKGASPGEADWEELVTRRVERCLAAEGPGRRGSRGEALLCSLGAGLRKICSLDNSQTDTQASIWADFESRQMVLSFRGTEQIKVKDVLTDINLVQARFFPGVVEQHSWGLPAGLKDQEEAQGLREVLVHKGFLSAFRSVEPAVLQLLTMVLIPQAGDSDEGDDDEPWTIHITGHSLGGALASLMTFDLARIVRGYHLGVEAPGRGAQDKAQGLLAALFSDQWQDPAPAFMGTSAGPAPLVASLRAAHTLTYTYGAPRVGNPRFSELSDRFAPHHFRVVNDRDVVPRVPRSSTANRLLEYSHAGRTVAVATNGTKDALWIEGQSQGPSPTQEVSPFADKYAGAGLPSALFSPPSPASSDDPSPPAEQQQLFDMEEQVASLLALHPATASQALSSAADRAVASGQSLLVSKLPEVLQAAGVGEEDLRQLDGLFLAARELSGGVQRQFIDRELEMLASILDSRALEHHLEPSYFEALLALTEADDTRSELVGGDD